jgi:hypothetical protein
LGNEERGGRREKIQKRRADKKKRDLTAKERKRIRKSIEKVIDSKDKKIKERWVKELYNFIIEDLERRTYWYTNEEMFNFIISTTLDDSHPDSIREWSFQILRKALIDARNDKECWMKWVNEIFLRVQSVIESPKFNSREVRLDALRVIEEIKERNGNLLPDILDYLINLHHKYYDNVYFNSGKYGFFHLDKHLSKYRTKDEQQTIAKMIETILENSELYCAEDRDIIEEYRKIYEKLSLPEI